MPTASTSLQLIRPKKAVVVRMNLDGLVRRLKSVLGLGFARATEAARREFARAKWEAGRWIHFYELHGSDRAKYGARLIPTIAERLGASPTYVKNILHFYRENPIGHARAQLPVTHYEYLTRVKNPALRKALERKAVDLELTSRELKSLVRKERLRLAANSRPQKKKIFPPLKPKRGKFFVYQILAPRGIHSEEGLYRIDTGFKRWVWVKESRLRNLKPGDLIESVRIEKNPLGDRYRLKRFRPPLVRGRAGRQRFSGGRPPEGVPARDLLYTFKAYVTKSVDDDTLWVDIDQGFRTGTEEKLRLRGINAAEIGKGKRASDFVKRTLAQVPFVVIKISGREKFGRALTDLFYKIGEPDPEKVRSEGIFLNQQLLDLGLAVRM